MGAGDAAQVPVVRLRRRREFLAAAATGRRWVAPAFVLQTGERAGRPTIGLGFTASRRIGMAVARNRARRRLKAAARAVLPGPAEPGYDYVIVARPAVLTCSFDQLLGDLETAFARVTRQPPRAPGRAGRLGSRAGRSGSTSG